MHMKQVYKKKEEKYSSSRIRLDILMTVIYYYMERENYKLLKFHMNNLSLYLK